jgi:hypothetical protein
MTMSSDTELRLGKVELDQAKRKLRQHDRQFTRAAKAGDHDELAERAAESDEMWQHIEALADELLRARP